jgi:hypothetical protein
LDLSLQRRPRLVSLNEVRVFFALCLCLAAASSALGQDQENKLVDRLLRPNKDMKNDAQDKKFIADSRSVDKKATVSTFYVQPKAKTKWFSWTPSYSTSEHSTQSFNGAHVANVSSQRVIPNAQQNYSTTTATNVRTAHDAGKKTRTGDFAGNRPFLDEGKSQKTLSKQNRPMTIDEVRELLNKNK